MKAMSRIGDTWITSKYDYHIHLAARTPKLKAYCLERYGFMPEVFESIHWDCIGTVRSAVKCITKTARVSKLMHGWLPIMHNLGKYKETSQCPGCECNDETFVHLYQCTHNLMRSVRTEKIKDLEQHLCRSSIKDRIVGLILRYVNSVVNMATITIDDESLAPELYQVVISQNKIGAVKMLQGYLSKAWIQAMEDYGEKHPNRQMTAILRGLWDELFEPIREMRNHILHDLPNRYNDALDKSNEEKLQWYYDHWFEVLSFHDCKFTEHSKEKIQAMQGKTKRQWVRELDRLRAIYEVELQQRQAGQQVLSKYFDCPSPTTIIHSS
jgi:hypothetical protein